MSIIERIIKVMEEKGIKQTRFAKGIRCSRSTALHWFANLANPPAKLIAPIAQYLGVSVQYLCTGEDPQLQSMTNAQESPELTELRRIFHTLTPQKQLDLLSVAFDMEEDKGGAIMR